MNSLTQYIGLENLNENLCIQAAYFSFKVRKQWVDILIIFFFQQNFSKHILYGQDHTQDEKSREELLN